MDMEIKGGNSKQVSCAATVRPTWQNEFLDGLTKMLPLTASCVPFALLVGALGTQVGLSPLEMLIMSATVFAGGSQFIALDIWEFPIPVFTIISVTAMVNLRHVLMSASVAPHIRYLPARYRIPFLGFLTDEIWAMTIKHSVTSRVTPAFVVGLAIPFYCNWVIWTVVGATAGSFLRDPERYGVDFVFTAVFLSLITGFCRTRRSLISILASLAAAWIAYLILPGVWYILCGGVAGTIVGAALYEEKSQ